MCSKFSTICSCSKICCKYRNAIVTNYSICRRTRGRKWKLHDRCLSPSRLPGKQCENQKNPRLHFGCKMSFFHNLKIINNLYFIKYFKPIVLQTAKSTTGAKPAVTTSNIKQRNWSLKNNRFKIWIKPEDPHVPILSFLKGDFP